MNFLKYVFSGLSVEKNKRIQCLLVTVTQNKEEALTTTATDRHNICPTNIFPTDRHVNGAHSAKILFNDISSFMEDYIEAYLSTMVFD